VSLDAEASSGGSISYSKEPNQFVKNLMGQYQQDINNFEKSKNIL
jgi:hypothetical protein